MTRTMADYAAQVPRDQPGAARGDGRDAGHLPQGRRHAYAAGDTWRQPDLAGTLEAIAAGGADAFYRGPLARTLATRVAAMGGIWTAADLAGYKVIEREPILFTYHGHDIITMPPPSAGGVTLRQILARQRRAAPRAADWDAADRIHLYVEALRRIYADRNALLGDPGFVEIPLTTLLDDRLHPEAHGRHRPRQGDAVAIRSGAARPSISRRRTSRSSTPPARRSPTPTRSTAASAPRCRCPAPASLLNNEMDDFTAKPGAPNMFGLVQGAAERDRSPASGCSAA